MNLFWTSADGDVLTLNNDQSGDYFYFGLTGIHDSPSSDVLMQRAPFQHGQTALRAQYRERAVKFTLLVRASTFADLKTKIATIGRIFASVSSINQLNRGTLQIDADDGATYFLSCIAMGAEMPATIPDRGPLHQRCAIYLTADDPFFTQDELNQALTQATPATVTNGGEFPVGPVIKIVGPSNSPKLTNTVNTVVRTMEVTANVAAGYRLEFDFRFGRKSILLVQIAGGAITDYFQYMADQNLDEFWELAVGSGNSVEFTSADAAGTATIYWTEKFQAI